MPRSRALGLVAAAATLSLLLVSCTLQAAPAPSPTPTPSPSPAPLPAGDGVLRIGTLFPTSGTSAFLAPAMTAGVELAVREINEAGGIAGAPIEVFHRDSGDVSGTVLETSFATLVAKKVDVVIGPASSALAERLLPKSIAAGLPVLSPAAIADALATPTNAGWFFRTVPPAAAAGAALAAALRAPAKVAVVSFDDAAGAAFTKTLEKKLKETKGELVAEQRFQAATTDFTPVVAAVAKTNPDAVVLVSPFGVAAQNKALITALGAEGLGGAKLWLTSGNLADYSQALPAGTMTNVNGILEGAEPDAAFTKRVLSAGPAVTNYRYAAEAYDAVMLAALAAIVADNDSGAAVARNLRAVSAGGIKCTSFGECLDVLKTEKDIDYDGIAGPLALNAAGDPSPANFGLYRYNAKNQYSRVGGILAG